MNELTDTGSLIPLYCKFLEAQQQGSLLKDDKVIEVVQKLNCDFSKFETQSIWSSQIGVAVRTEILDQAVRTFLAHNPYSVVVNLGAGLCTRFWRVDNGSVRWFEVDLPPVKRLWSKVFSETDRHRYLPYSVMGYCWLNELKPLISLPFLFIAEDLLMYFTEADVKRLIQKIKAHFPQVEMLIEVVSPIMVKHAKRHPMISRADAVFRWGLKTGQELETWDSDIHLIDEWYCLDYHGDRWRWMKWFKYIPTFRKAFKLVHLRFT